MSQVCDRESCDKGGGGSAKGDVFASCVRASPKAAWGGGVTEPGRWHRGHQEGAVKLMFLCQYTLSAAFGAEDSALEELQRSLILWVCF